MPPVHGTTKTTRAVHQHPQRAASDLDVVSLIEQLTQLSTELSKKYEELNAREAALVARENRLNEREATLLKTVQLLLDSQTEHEKELCAELAELQQTGLADASPLGTDAPPAAVPRVPHINMASVARDCGDVRSAQRSGDRGASPAHYEGPVDPTVPSHVEEIVDEADVVEQKPRGLRSSPQFQPMDPNDSGRNFLRRGQAKRDEAVRRKPLRYEEEQDEDDDFYDESDDAENDVADEDNGDDEESEGLDDVDPALFDEAVAYLTNSGLVSLAQIRQWLGEGAHPSQIVELYLREARVEMEGVEDDGAYEENDEDEDDGADDGYGDDGNGEEHEGEEVPLTADTGAIKAVDEADTPPRSDRVDGVGLAAARVRGTSSPQAAAKHRAYNSFDDSSSGGEDDGIGDGGES